MQCLSFWTTAGPHVGAGLSQPHWSSWSCCALPSKISSRALRFSWHHLRALYGHEIFIFLDKVCIDQKNSERKTKGIKAIGGILKLGTENIQPGQPAGQPACRNRSKTLLVAWDRSYFSRLCLAMKELSIEAAQVVHLRARRLPPFTAGRLHVSRISLTHFRSSFRML